MKATAFAVVSSDLCVVCLIIKHNIMPKEGHQDELEQLFRIILFFLQENIIYNFLYLNLEHHSHPFNGVRILRDDIHHNLQKFRHSLQDQ